MSDEISLTLPSEQSFHGVAHLVLGGLAARLGLSFEKLEDIQLALDGLLERYSEDGEVTVTVRVDGDELHTIVGPFSASLEAELESGGDDLDLRRILDIVCDRFRVEERADGRWVELTNGIERRNGN